MGHYIFGSKLHSIKKNGLTTSGNYNNQGYQYTPQIQIDRTGNRLLSTTTTLLIETTPTTITATANTATHIRTTMQTLHLLANNTVTRGANATTTNNIIVHNNKTNLPHHPTIPTTTITSLTLATPSEIPSEQWA